MASVFAYFRPRGVPGNYKVGILLEGSPTETIQVRMMHVPAAFVGDLAGTIIGNKLFYTKTALTGDWLMEIIIRDKDISFPQRIGYLFTQENIRGELAKGMYVSPVMFHEIILVDLDEMTQAARQGKIHELEYMPEIAEVRQLLQQD
jgi:hypothetical protein